MILLPNCCSRSEFVTYPSNWKQSSADINLTWYIKYRFYEPGYDPVQKVVKANMNKVKVLRDRQAMMRALLEEEERLLNNGYNPRTNTLPKDSIEQDEVLTTRAAFEQAYNKIFVNDRTKKDIHNTLKLIPEITTPIKDFKRKDIKKLLEKISTTPDRYNKNRTNLMILYNDIVEDELIDANPIHSIKKKKVIKKIKVLLTPDERKNIREHLLQYPGFYRFIQIFFHGGIRVSEILKVKYDDVDIKNQRFKVTILKGSQYREVWKTIKNIAVPYWITQIKNCKPGEYLFSNGFEPGPDLKTYDYVNQNWQRRVQDKLGVKASLYSLKHLHSDEIAAGIGLSVAGSHNDHKGTVITMTYAVNEKKRMEELIKTADNSF